jgi:hypothetical protein
MTQNTAYKWQEMKNRRRVVGGAKIELISPTTSSYKTRQSRRSVTARTRPVISVPLLIVE